MSEKPTVLLSAVVTWSRVLIVAAIAIVLGLIVTTPRNEYPLNMSRAQAGTLCAAPGYLTTSLAGGNDRFYLIDTTKQVICVYSVTGDALRLVAARKFDYDSDIVDGSTVQKGIKIEGGNGISRDDAKVYWDELKGKIDEMVKKRKPK